MQEALIRYSGYFLALIAFIFAIIQHHLRRRTEIANLKFQQEHADETSRREKRFSVYREYLNKLDGINSKLSAGMSADMVAQETTAMLESIFNNPDDLSGVATYLAKIQQFSVTWAQEQNKALEELNGLRLVCSEPILSMLDDYADAARSYLQETSQMLQHMDVTNPQAMIKADKTKLMETYEKLKKVRHQIEVQMRKDIGVAS